MAVQLLTPSGWVTKPPCWRDRCSSLKWFCIISHKTGPFHWCYWLSSGLWWFLLWRFSGGNDEAAIITWKEPPKTPQKLVHFFKNVANPAESLGPPQHVRGTVISITGASGAQSMQTLSSDGRRGLSAPARGFRWARVIDTRKTRNSLLVLFTSPWLN